MTEDMEVARSSLWTSFGQVPSGGRPVACYVSLFNEQKLQARGLIKVQHTEKINGD